MTRFRKPLLPLLMAAALYWTSCRPVMAPAQAGGGSDTEITGTIAAMAGSSPSGIQVRLVPDSHNPLEEDAYREILTARTVGPGRYRFRGVEPGGYRIEANHPGDGSRLAIRNIRLEGKDLEVPPDSLREPGSLILHLSEGAVPEGGFIYIPGTPYVRRVEAGARNQVLDSLPAGPVETLLLARGDVLRETEVLAREVSVEPGAAIRLGPFAAWSRSLKLRVDAGAAGLSGPLRDFPLLVRLTGEDINFSQAGASGEDIRFAKDDGTALPFEIEAWDAGAGLAAVWVKLDTVPADSAAGFRMHWGNPSAPPAGDGAAVFPAEAAYAGVWHMGRMGHGPGVGVGEGGEPASGRISLADASAQGNHGEFLGPGEENAGVPGLVAGGIRFDGKSQSVTTAKSFDNPSEFSLSLWFRTATTQGGKLIGLGAARTDTSQDFDRHFWMGGDGRVHFGIFQDWRVPENPGDTVLVLSSPGALNDGEWHFLAATVSAGGTRVFVDGKEIGALPGANRPARFTGYWRMGFDGMNARWPHLPASMHFAGDLDEMRIVHRELTPDWLRLVYENAKPGSGTVVPSDP